MKNQKKWFLHILTAFCFCMVVGAFSSVASASFWPTACEHCGALLGEGFEVTFTDYCYAYYSSCYACGAPSPAYNPEMVPSHTWVQQTSTNATCTDAGEAKYECSNCSAFKTESISALGHTWEETSRINATQTAAGSIEYTCSACGSTQMEQIPPLGPDFTLSGLLEKITEVLTSCLSWVGTVANVIAGNPVLLLVVVIGFIGTGVTLFRRVLRL